MAEEEALGEVDVGGRIDGRKADYGRKILLTPVSGGVQSPVPVLPKLVIFAPTETHPKLGHRTIHKTLLM